MIVGVDAGNTRIKWMSIDGLYSDTANTPNQLVQQLQDLGVQRLVVSSVCGLDTDALLATLSSASLGVEPEFYYTEPQYQNMVCAYENYQAMGGDRWLAIIGAWQRYRQAVLVIDIGTAITIDLVAEAGVHQGGYIAPGFHRLVDAINTGTQLINVEPMSELPISTLGKSTAQCLSLGCGEMLAAFINQTVATYKNALPVYTGGGYDLIRNHLVNKGVHHQSLVFDGLFERSVYQTLKK